MKLGPLKIDLWYVFFILFIVGMVFGSLFLFHKAKTEIHDAGGVKQIIIDVGKEIKDIRKQIDE